MTPRLEAALKRAAATFPSLRTGQLIANAIETGLPPGWRTADDVEDALYFWIDDALAEAIEQYIAKQGG